MESFSLILAIVVVTALAFDFTNGFHDTANAMATTISTGALKPKVAVAMSATLNLVGNGRHSFSNGLSISTNASLIGNGTITGAVSVSSGGTFVPGTSVGRIALSNSPGLAGTTIMEISKSSSVLTNDQIQVTGLLTYGGTLTVINIGPDALALGDRFPLFNASGYGGAFSVTNRPELRLFIVDISEVDFTGHSYGSFSRAYREAAGRADANIRDFYAWLEKEGHLEDCTVIISSDHGLWINDHSYLLSEQEKYTPLIFLGPRVRSCRLDGQASIMDINANISYLLGVRYNEHSQGRVYPQAFLPAGGVADGVAVTSGEVTGH